MKNDIDINVSLRWGLYPQIVEEALSAMIRMEGETSEPFHSFYAKYSPEWILRQFKSDIENGVTVKVWDRIPAEQYETLLDRFMEEPMMARIPDSVVTGWIMTIFKNFCQTISISKLCGRDMRFPYEALRTVFEDAPKDDDFNRCLFFLKDRGFFKWATVYGDRACTDFGFDPLLDILKNYNENMTPEEKLIMVNRCLDVTHKRGLMADWFIEGGYRTCERISHKKKRGV